jgi:hypothetical protein
MQHKKWFQVIRVATPLLASMLGIERCGARETGGRLVMLAAVSSGAAGLDWGGPLPVSPVRSRHLKAGFSLAHDDGRRATVMGSLFPTCFFNVSLDRPSRSRSARNSSLIRFASASAISTPRARCPDFSPSIPVSPRINRFAFGVSLTLGITSFTPICYREAHLPKLPDP